MAAAYVYDDFRVTFTPRGDDTYDVRAVDATGTVTTASFRIPLDDDQLQQRILGVARASSRKASAARTSDPASGSVTRDVGTSALAHGVGPTDARALGGALGDALFDGPLGDAYDAARRRASGARRGLRLSLALTEAPHLLSVPWEFVYRRPQFLASQRKTPLVRVLECGEASPPPAIDDKVRILGVVASPDDLSPLDVDEERARVDRALATVIELGRVELTWLQPATRRRLREVLRDGDFHVIHYVGHSDFTADGEGVLFLEDDDGTAVTLDSIELANLVGDLSNLRLVVLNSCEGARTTLTDPYAGVATTLIQLGVPAVCAMQFEISDDAAILFAEVLYTNLIGQEASVDAAVAEARKAIFNEIDHVEFATPVLFVHDPDLELFTFEVGSPPLPPPPPPTFPDADDDADDDEPAPPELTITPTTTVSPLRRRAPFLIGGGIVAALVIGGAIAFGSLGADEDASGGSVVVTDPPGASTTVVGTTLVGATSTTLELPTTRTVRPRTGFVAVPILDDRDRDGDNDRNETHLFAFDPRDPDRAFNPATDRNHARDTHPTWERTSNRLAFERSIDATTSVAYVVPGNGVDDNGKQVQPLVTPADGDQARLPSWSGEAELVYSLTDGCASGPGCEETILRQRFAVSDAMPDRGRYLGFRSLDTLTPDGAPHQLSAGMIDVSAIAADQSGSGVVAVADSAGVWIISSIAVQLMLPDVGVASMAFTPDGSALVVAEAATSAGARLFVLDADGTTRSTTSIEDLDRTIGATGELVGEAHALSPGTRADRVLALVDQRGDAAAPRLAELTVADGAVTVATVDEPPTWLLDRGLLRGVAL